MSSRGGGGGKSEDAWHGGEDGQGSIGHWAFFGPVLRGGLMMHVVASTEPGPQESSVYLFF
jgi:hypothetical protein